MELGDLPLKIHRKLSFADVAILAIMELGDLPDQLKAGLKAFNLSQSSL